MKSGMKSESPLAAAQRFLERWGVLVAFGLLVVASTMLQGGDFLNPENFRTLLNSNAAIGVLAVGMTLVIVSAGIDLSVGSMVVLSAAVDSTSGHDTRMMSAPTSSHWRICSIVALASEVSVLVISVMSRMVKSSG
jgi:ribose/xylose/arabinose/galactoside ABC-type transport system permease subunit